MPLPISIRPETPADYAAITQVNDRAFGRSNEGTLVEHLRQLPEFEPRLSLVADLDGEIVGHVLLNPVKIGENERAFTCLSLGPIAVLPEYQKMGIGGKLIAAGHRAALDLGYTAVILLGHPEYYPRFGYQPADRWGLTNNWKVSGAPWMAVELIAGALHGKSGLVIYPEPFNQAN